MAANGTAQAPAEGGHCNKLGIGVDVQYCLAIAVRAIAPDGEGAHAVGAHVAEGHCWQRQSGWHCFQLDIGLMLSVEKYFRIAFAKVGYALSKPFAFLIGQAGAGRRYPVHSVVFTLMTGDRHTCARCKVLQFFENLAGKFHNVTVPPAPRIAWQREDMVSPISRAVTFSIVSWLVPLIPRLAARVVKLRARGANQGAEARSVCAPKNVNVFDISPKVVWLHYTGAIDARKKDFIVGVQWVQSGAAIDGYVYQQSFPIGVRGIRAGRQRKTKFGADEFYYTGSSTSIINGNFYRRSPILMHDFGRSRKNVSSFEVTDSFLAALNSNPPDDHKAICEEY